MTAAELIVERWRRIRIMDDFLVITTLGFVWTLSIIVSMAIAIKWQEKHDKRKWKDINRAEVIAWQDHVKEANDHLADCREKQFNRTADIARDVKAIRLAVE